MGITRDRELLYSLIRLQPDLEREEFATVGVLLWDPRMGIVRLKTLIEPSPLVRAIAPPSVRASLQELPFAIQDRLKRSGVIWQQNAVEYGLNVGRGVTDGIAVLIDKGIRGFEFLEPSPVLVDSARESDEEAIERLFDDFVRPRRWPWGGHAGRSRLDSDVRKFVRARVTERATNVAVGLRVRAGYVAHDFPVAYANGKASFVQAVDLDVSSVRREIHTSSAIAQVAETNRLLQSFAADLEWITVVRRGDDSGSYERRLENFSSRVVPENDLTQFVRDVEREATTPIESFFMRIGLQAVREHSAVELVVG
jgi:DUF3037 family protein